MAIVQLGSVKNITELAQRLYGLTASDTRVATAVKALTAANPNLPADLSSLPPPTLVVVPAVDGLAPAPQASAVPQDINLLDLMRSVGNASAQIVTAAESASASAPDTTRAALLQPFAAALPALKLAPAVAQEVDPKKLSAQLKVLSGSVAGFVKQHGG